MAAKKSDLVTIAHCGKCDTKDNFALESNDSSRKCECERERYSEERVLNLEKSLESVKIRANGFENINGHKNADVLMENGAGSMDDEGAGQRREGGSSELPKEPKPVKPQHIPKGEIIATIEEAIESDQHFFFGVCPLTKGKGQALHALYECEGRTLDRKGKYSSSSHPVDHKVKKERHLKLVKSFHTDPLKVNNALIEYKSLKSKYFGKTFCVNDNPENPTLKTEKAIVYLRIYA